MRQSLLLLIGMALLAVVPLTSAKVQQGSVTKLKDPKGVLQAYYDDSSSHCCNAVVLLNVGTAMSVGDYSDLAEHIVQQSPGIVTIIMDTNPRWIQKQDGTNYINVANTIASDITNLVPSSCCQQQPRHGYFIGGHSGGGEGAVHALMGSNKHKLNFPVAGYIGLAPYKIQEVSIGVPSLNWGFSNTTCGVDREHAAMAAYSVSPTSSRVFYDVFANKTFGSLGGPHCSFTDSGCVGMCSGQPDYDWIHQAVGESVQKFASAVSSKHTFTQRMFDLGRAGINLYVNSDTVLVPSNKTEENTSSQHMQHPRLAESVVS